MTSTTRPPPLITIFTPVAACGDPLWVTEQSSIVFTRGPTSTPDCVPPGWAPTSASYFSPGICPSGYDIARITTSTGSAVVETAAVCCPHGYTDNESVTGLPAYQTILPCASSLVYNQTYVVVLSRSGTVFTSLSSGTYPINAYSVQVRWQYTDSAVLQYLSTTAAPQPTFQTSAPPVQTSMPPTDAGSLSLGAKIGIGVGVPVFVLALLALGICIFVRRRRGRQGGGVPDRAGRITPYSPKETTNRHAETRHYGHELQAPTSPRPKELTTPSTIEYASPLEKFSPAYKSHHAEPSRPVELGSSAPNPIFSEGTANLNSESRLYRQELEQPTFPSAHGLGISPVAAELSPGAENLSSPTRKPVPLAAVGRISEPAPRSAAEVQPASTAQQPARMASEDEAFGVPFYTNPALQPVLPGDGGDKTEDVAALEQRIERVRQETERLVRLQALRDEEAQLRARIEAKRASRPGRL